MTINENRFRSHRSYQAGIKQGSYARVSAKPVSTREKVEGILERIARWLERIARW